MRGRGSRKPDVREYNTDDDTHHVGPNLSPGPVSYTASPTEIGVSPSKNLERDKPCKPAHDDQDEQASDQILATCTCHFGLSIDVKKLSDIYYSILIIFSQINKTPGIGVL